MICKLRLDRVEHLVARVHDKQVPVAIAIRKRNRNRIRTGVVLGLELHGDADAHVFHVNNAGVFDKYATLLDTDGDLWDRIYDTNVKSIYRITRLVLPNMLNQGGGAIVNVASIAGLVAGKGGAAYTSSKHAVIGLTKHIASEYGKSGIRANAICPGTIVTPLIAEVVDNIPKDNVPMRRFGEPSEVAQLCLFLAGDDAQFVNGAVIPIDGGYTVQ